jgi:tRNA U34 5-carboxymethylaminomethyl modifying GTPase MnmE/TrmE
LPNNKSDAIRISAKTGKGIDVLLNEIQKQLQVCGFDSTLPAVFTGRQKKLLQAITESNNQQQIRQFLTDLMTGC